MLPNFKKKLFVYQILQQYLISLNKLSKSGTLLIIECCADVHTVTTAWEESTQPRLP